MIRFGWTQLRFVAALKFLVFVWEPHAPQLLKFEGPWLEAHEWADGGPAVGKIRRDCHLNVSWRLIFSKKSCFLVVSALPTSRPLS